MLLRRRIQISLAGLLTLFAGSGFYLTRSSEQLHALNVRLFIDTPSIMDAQQVETGLRELRSLTRANGAASSADEDAIRKRMADVQRALDVVERHAQTTEERLLLDTLRERMNGLDPAHADRTVIAASLTDAALVTAFNQREIDETLARSTVLSREAHRAAIILVSAGLLVGALVSVTLWRAISVPLERLFTAVRRMEQGDSSVRVGPGKNDELGRLGRALDSMLDAEARREEDMAAFVAGVAHDLRTPLSTISTSVSLLRSSASDQTTLARASVVERQVARLDRLLDELMRISRIAADEKPARTEILSLDALVSDAFALFRDLSPRHHLTLSVEPVQVRASPDLLMRVLANLLSNALKYSPNGGAVDVTVRNLGREAEVSVQDEGIGIPDDARAKIFARFARVEADGSVPGSGLGLFLARRIAHQHGGSLDFESESGRGSRFFVRLPLAGAEPHQPGATIH